MQPTPLDPSLGVFETLLVRDGRVQALTAHLERLGGSVSELYGRELPGGLETEVAARAGSLRGTHRLRVDAVPDRDGLRIDILTSELQGGGTDPVLLTPVELQGGLGAHKWADRRLIDSLAQRSPGVPLLIDSGGDVLEGARANVWLLDGRRLLTPPADGRILPGVTRALLLELAPSLGLESDEEQITLAHLGSAPVIFLTSGLRHAVAATLDGQLEGQGVDPDPVGETATLNEIRAALSRCI